MDSHWGNRPWLMLLAFQHEHEYPDYVNVCYIFFFIFQTQLCNTLLSETWDGGHMWRLQVLRLRLYCRVRFIAYLCTSVSLVYWIYQLDIEYLPIYTSTYIVNVFREILSTETLVYIPSVWYWQLSPYLSGRVFVVCWIFSYLPQVSVYLHS